jgi:hypothetical protein
LYAAWREAKKRNHPADFTPQTPSDVVRIALENHLREGRHAGSAYALAKAAKLIGCVRRAPRDLSINPQHFESFGTGK